MKQRLLLLTGLSASLAGCFGYFPGRLKYWDARMNELCAKDGGKRVFEIIYLPDEAYALLLNTRGELALPHEKSTPNKPSAVYERRLYETLREREPSVTRDELQIVRRSDGKVLATKVTYSTAGGNFNPPTIAERGIRQRWCPNQELDRVFYSEVVKKTP